VAGDEGVEAAQEGLASFLHACVERKGEGKEKRVRSRSRCGGLEKEGKHVRNSKT